LIARIDSEVGSVLDLTDAEVMEGIPANPPKVGKDQSSGNSVEPSQQDVAATMKALALQERHEKMMAALVDEEEAMITSHRRHIDSMVSGLKEQMETLNEVDQPGSDVEHYVKSLLDGLQEQEKRILELRSGLRTFKKNLDEERLVSEQAEQLHRDALRAGGPQGAW
jgi:kinesin family protein 2/24